MQGRVADAHCVHGAGAVVLDDDVGMFRELVHEPQTVGVLHVHREAALAA